MAYTINRSFSGADFADIDSRTRKALGEKGFGVQAVLKKKIDADIPAYRILGACNPHMAHQAMQLEPRVGAMLPCNVIIRQLESGIEVSAIDPVASMSAIENPKLHAVAGEVRDLLASAVAAI